MKMHRCNFQIVYSTKKNLENLFAHYYGPSKNFKINFSIVHSLTSLFVLKQLVIHNLIWFLPIPDPIS